MSVEFLTLDDLLDLASAMGVPHVRDMGLLESARLRPQTVLYGVETYPLIAEKAATYLESIVRNHPLLDGNKRLGWASAVTFLALNGEYLATNDDDAFEFVVGIAAGEVNFEAIVEWIESRLKV